MNVLQKIKARGLLYCMETVFNRIVPCWIFRFSVGTILELDRETLCELIHSFEPDEFIFQRVTDPEQRETLRTLTWNSVPRETTEDDRGYSVSRRDDPTRMLGGVWGGVDSFIESDLGFRIRLTEDQAWIYCAYVDPSTRGKRVYPRVLSTAANDLSGLGVKRLLVVIQPWNKASMRAHRKYSHGPVGHLAVLRIFTLAMVFRFGSLTQVGRVTTNVRWRPVEIRIGDPPNR